MAYKAAGMNLFRKLSCASVDVDAAEVKPIAVDGAGKANTSGVCSVATTKHEGMTDTSPRRGVRGPPIYIPFLEGMPASGRIVMNVSTKHQVMEGFGGSLAFFQNWVSEHPNASEIYDAMFTDLRLSVLRLRNSFEQPTPYLTADQILDIDKQFVEAAKERLGDLAPRILMSSWTPPAALKQNESLTGGDRRAVLKKDAFGNFIYKDFAKYWLDSLTEYALRGVEPTWISIQNEPDYNTAAHDTCIFDPSESYYVPGYYKAFDVTYDVLHANLARAPLMVAPETAGFDRYRDHPYAGSPRIAAQAGHIYGAGDKFNASDFFDRLPVTLRNGDIEAKDKQVKKVFMTEYANLQDHQVGDPLKLARCMYETLTIADAGMYLQWDLAWGRGFGEGTMSTCGVASTCDWMFLLLVLLAMHLDCISNNISLLFPWLLPAVLVDNPFDGDTESWANEKGFTKLQSYEWFKYVLQCCSSRARERMK